MNSLINKSAMCSTFVARVAPCIIVTLIVIHWYNYHKQMTMVDWEPSHTSGIVRAGISQNKDHISHNPHYVLLQRGFFFIFYCKTLFIFIIKQSRRFPIQPSNHVI